MNSSCRYKRLLLIIFFLLLTSCHIPNGITKDSNAHKPASAKDQGVTGFELLPLSIDEITEKLADKQVVFIGENHDRYDHHLNQLAIIRQLHKLHPDLAIGMEYFQQPFQKHLDAYVAGKLEEQEFLKATEYYSRWQYDYRLYRPILQYARENKIPLIALNIAREISNKVGRSGLESLSATEKAQIPKMIDRSNEAYQQRLKAVFQQHPHAGERNFDYFLEAQLLWDAGMAQRAADYLQEHPGTHLVVLAGAGHLMYPASIPDRLKHRVPAKMATVMTASQELEIGTDMMADIFLSPQSIQLPPPGLLGIYMTGTNDGVIISDFSKGGAAQDAGLRKQDIIVSLGGEAIHSPEDIKLALLDKQPGDLVELKINRNNGSEHATYNIKLR